MKEINKNTLLRCRNKTYQPVEVDGVIYWVNQPLDEDGCIVPKSIVALTKPKFINYPIISLIGYAESIAHLYGSPYSSQYYNWKEGFIDGYNSNPNQYTQKDIEKAIDLARNYNDGWDLTEEEILEQINQISEIIVDEQFNIISYE